MLAPIVQPAVENSPAIFAKLMWLFSMMMQLGINAKLG